MKVCLLSICLVACAPITLAQQSDSLQVHLPAATLAKLNAATPAPQPETHYMQYIISLTKSDVSDWVVPMQQMENGQENLRFFADKQIEEAEKQGYQFIRFGEIMDVLSYQFKTIDKLQAENAALQTENEKLWKIAMKDQPATPPPTVVVQASPPQQPSPLERYMMIQSLLSRGQSYSPYRLPQPIPLSVSPTAPQANCTTNKIGSTMYTTCN